MPPGKGKAKTTKGWDGKILCPLGSTKSQRWNECRHQLVNLSFSTNAQRKHLTHKSDDNTCNFWQQQTNLLNSLQNTARKALSIAVMLPGLDLQGTCWHVLVRFFCALVACAKKLLYVRVAQQNVHFFFFFLVIKPVITLRVFLVQAEVPISS